MHKSHARNGWSKDVHMIQNFRGKHVYMNWVKMCSESYKVPAFFASLRACRSLLISLTMVPSLRTLASSGAAHTTARRRTRDPIGCISSAFALLVSWCLPNSFHTVNGERQVKMRLYSCWGNSKFAAITQGPSVRGWGCGVVGGGMYDRLSAAEINSIAE